MMSPSRFSPGRRITISLFWPIPTGWSAVSPTDHPKKTGYARSANSSDSSSAANSQPVPFVLSRFRNQAVLWRAAKCAGAPHAGYSLSSLMLFRVCLLTAAQIAGGSPHAAPNGKAPVAERRAVSLPQAEARMVAKFNQLAAAMRDFSHAYNGTHTVNARKAEAV